MNTTYNDNIIEKINKLHDVAFNIHKLYDYDIGKGVADDISKRQTEILIAVSFFDINNVTSLSKQMRISKSTLSIIIGKMENKGLLIRIRNADSTDSRCVRVESTDKGKEVIFSFIESHLKRFATLYDRLDSERRNYFKKGIDELRKVAPEGHTLYSRLCEAIFKDNSERFSAFSAEILEMSANMMYFTAVFFENSGLKNDLDNLCEDTKLTFTQFNIMILIYEHNIRSISELEKLTGTSVSALSICISRLEKKNYIEKRYDKTNDGRRMYMYVTDEGKSIMHREKQKLRNSGKSFLSNLGSEGIDHYNMALDDLLTAFKQYDQQKTV